MKITDLTSEEREIHISQTADDRSVFTIYTDDPIWIERLRKLGIAEDTASNPKDGIGKYFILPANQLTIRRKRIISEEERDRKRQQIADNMSRARKGL